jgi:DNA-binding MarR family transcriptional regulator
MTISNDKGIGAASVRLSKKITRLINLFLKPYNITTEQWSVLRTLHETDDIAQKDLSNRVDKDQATLTKILDILEKNRFAERISNPIDRRSYLIRITEKGRKLVGEVTPYLERIYDEMVKDIESEKIDIFKEVMLSLEGRIDYLFEEGNN